MMMELIDLAVTVVRTRSGAPVSLILGIILAISGIILFTSFAKRYKRCPKGKALVVTGKTLSDQPEAHLGGAQFIWPLIQDYALLDLSPITIALNSVRARTANKITLTLAATATVAISQNPPVLQNAALRLLGLEPDKIVDHAQGALTAQLIEAASAKTADEIDDPATFLPYAKERMAPGLKELGLELVSFAITDLKRPTPPPMP